MTADLPARPVVPDPSDTVACTKHALEIVLACDDLFVRATDDASLAQDVCELLVSKCGYLMAWVGFASDDMAKTVKPIGWAGKETGYLKTVRISWADDQYGQGPTGRAIRSRTPFVCADTEHDPAFAPWRADAVKRGYRSSVAIPMLVDGGTVGAINLYAAVPGGFGDYQLQILTHIASNLGHAIATLSQKRALAESENRLSFVLANTNDGYFDWDLVSSQAYFSPRYYELLGYKPGEFPANFESFRSLAHPDDVAMIERSVRSYAEGNRNPFSMEIRVRAKDGSWKWILSRGNVVSFSADGKPLRMVGVHTDLTDRKVREIELERTKQELLRSQQIAHVGSFTRNFVTGEARWSDEYYRMLGLDPTHPALPFDAMKDMIYPSDRPLFDACLERLSTTDEHVEADLRHIMPDGSIRYLHLVAYGVRDTAGKLVSVSGAALDTTDMMLVQNELKVSNARFHAFMKAFPGFAFVKNKDQRYTYVNERFASAYGRPVEKWIGKTFGEVFPQVGHIDVEKADEAVLNQSITVESHKRMPMGGGERVLLYIKFPIPDGVGGNLLGGFAIDMTDRFEFEAKQSYLASFPERDPNPIVEFDEAGNMRYVNPAFTEALRYLGHPDNPSYLLPPDFDVTVAAFNARTATASHMILSVGDHTYVLSVLPLYDIGVIRYDFSDVTDVYASLHTAESERQSLKGIVDAMPVGVTFIDRFGDMRIANAQAMRLLGISDLGNGLRFTKSENLFLTPEGEPVTPEMLPEQLAATGGDAVYMRELRLIRSDKTETSVTVRALAIRDTAGDRKGVVCVYTDNTLKANGEDHLKRRIAYVSAILDGLPIAIALVSVDEQRFDYCNYLFNRWSGVRGMDAPPPMAFVEGMVVDEQVRQNIVAMLKTPAKPFSLDSVRLRLYDGSEIITNIVGTPFNGGRYLVLSLMNVDELSRIEETLRVRAHTSDLSRIRAETVMDHASFGLITVDARGIVLSLNSAAEQLIGSDRATIVGKPLVECLRLTDASGAPIPDEDRPMVRALASGQRISTSIANPVFYQRMDGKRAPFWVSAVPIVENGKVSGGVESLRDISIEYEVDRTNNQFLTVASHQLLTPLGIMRWNLEMLQRGDLGAVSAETIDAIQQLYENNLRIISLVGDLLNVSHIEEGRVQTVIQQTDLHKLVLDVIRDLDPLAKRHGVRLISTIVSGSIPSIYVDRRQTYEILKNLLTNGIKYNRPVTVPSR